MTRQAALPLIALAMLAVPATAVVVDHDDIDAVASLPQSTMDTIGQQKWFFSHASVGGNMTQGMTNLRTANPTRYRLVVTSAGYNSSLQRANNPPSPTVNGRIYDCDRGNPGWQAKLTIFDNSVRIAGWHESAVNVAMDKFCYIDPTASATSYISTMTALEAAFPTTVFVYITMPLTSDEGSDNVLRNQYNAAVRNFCIGNNKLLYDLADMEAHDPAGNQYTFTSGGKTYQKLYSGYTSDGGHLNTAGQQRIAMGWYAVAAVIAVPFAPGDLNGDGRVDKDDLDLFEDCASGPGIHHGGSLTCERSDFDHDGDVDHTDFGVFQRCLTRTGVPDPALPVDPGNRRRRIDFQKNRAFLRFSLAFRKTGCIYIRTGEDDDVFPESDKCRA